MARRCALLQHSAAFLDGPYWRAIRSHVAAGVLHPSRFLLLGNARARVLGDLVGALKSGAPAGESLHFVVYSILAEMCFGKDTLLHNRFF